MDLIKQCAIWNEKEEYQTIIDAIEALSLIHIWCHSQWVTRMLSERVVPRDRDCLLYTSRCV